MLGGRAAKGGQGGVKVIDFSEVPSDILPLIVGMVARMAFHVQQWSAQGARHPVALFCDEANLDIPQDATSGAAENAIATFERIAKEGRKYGVHLALVTQRPAELDAIVMSQCSTLFMMRMSNDEDQSIMRSAVSDAAANLLSFIPTLGTGEVVGIGEGMPLAARFAFNTLPDNLLPSAKSDTAGEDNVALGRSDLVKRAIERWRRATMSQARITDQDAPPPRPSPSAEGQNAVTRGLQSLASERPPIFRTPGAPLPPLGRS